MPLLVPTINLLCSFILSLNPTLFTVSNSHCLLYHLIWGKIFFSSWLLNMILLIAHLLSHASLGLFLISQVSNAPFLAKSSLPSILFLSHHNFFFAFKTLNPFWIHFCVLPWFTCLSWHTVSTTRHKPMSIPFCILLSILLLYC